MATLPQLNIRAPPFGKGPPCPVSRNYPCVYFYLFLINIRCVQLHLIVFLPHPIQILPNLSKVGQGSDHEITTLARTKINLQLEMCNVSRYIPSGWLNTTVKLGHVEKGEMAGGGGVCKVSGQDSGQEQGVQDILPRSVAETFVHLE